MYSWPLWRNWTGPKRVKVETVAEVRRRQIRHKPTVWIDSAGVNGLTLPYPWKLWHEHKRREVRHG